MVLFIIIATHYHCQIKRTNLVCFFVADKKTDLDETQIGKETNLNKPEAQTRAV